MYCIKNIGVSLCTILDFWMTGPFGGLLSAKMLVTEFL